MTETAAEVPRCQNLSPSPWGITQCALPLHHEEGHAYSPSEGAVALVHESTAYDTDGNP